MFVSRRFGVLSVTSLKISSRISTTAHCSAWTAQRSTQRKTQYLVGRRPLSRNHDCQSSLTCLMFAFLSVTRVQFFAIEIARNREGHNDAVFTSKPSKSQHLPSIAGLCRKSLFQLSGCPEGIHFKETSPMVLLFFVCGHLHTFCMQSFNVPITIFVYFLTTAEMRLFV